MSKSEYNFTMHIVASLSIQFQPAVVIVDTIGN